MMATQTHCERRPENCAEHYQHFWFQKLPSAIGLAVQTSPFLMQTNML